MKCSICGKRGTNRRSHPNHLQTGGGGGSPISAKITLSLRPTCGIDSEDCLDGHNKVKNNQERAKEIIRESLYDIDIKDLTLNPSKMEATFTATTKKSLTAEKFKRTIEDNYGDAAADTWMEGDISFPYDSDGELELDLLKVEIVPYTL